MKQEYKRDLNNNYMILSDESANKLDDYRVRMLISNQIPFLLKCNVRKQDGEVKYFYEITSRHPMSRVFDKKKIGKAELVTIITSFLKVIESISQYLLNPNDFILEPEFIYMNLETNQVYFCYMPGYESDVSKGFHSLTSYILEKIDYDDKYSVAVAYELYRKTLEDNYSLREILNAITDELKQEDNKKQEEPVIDTTIQEPFVPEEKEEKKTSLRYQYMAGGAVIITGLVLLGYFLLQQKDIIKGILQQEDLLFKIGGVSLIIIVLVVYFIYNKRQNKQVDSESMVIVPEENIQEPKELKRKEIEREDIIYSEVLFEKAKKEERDVLEKKQATMQEETYGNTVLLAYRPQNKKLISCIEKYQSFELTQKLFLIGKMQEHVDGIIQDELVSRIHAEIRKEDEKYYLTDLNSTNGTFHNKRRLEANETVEIKSQDILGFAKVEYIFQ